MGALRTIPVEARGLGNKRRSGDHLDYNIIKIGQHTGKSPGETIS